MVKVHHSTMTTPAPTPALTLADIFNDLHYHVNMPAPHQYNSDWGYVHGPYLYHDPDFENKRKKRILICLDMYEKLVKEQNINIDEYVGDINLQELDRDALKNLYDEEYNNIFNAFKKVSFTHIKSSNMLEHADCQLCYKHCNRFVFILRKTIVL